MDDSQIFGEPRSFHAELKGRNAKVLIGGQDITRAVRGFSVMASAPYAMDVTLDLAVYDATEIQSDTARVVMHPETRRLLIAAGWTPPTASAPEAEGLA